MIKVGDELEVKIEKMANRGKGIGRVNEQVVFVPYSAPDDLLKVKILKVSKNFVDAEIVEILKPSRMRVTAPCPHYTQCGGCHFQHIEYPKQVEIKDGLVKETIQRALGLTDDSIFLDPIYSPQQWNYRNRIQIHIHNKSFGFVKRNSNTVIPIESCPIAEPALNEELKNLKFKDLSDTEKLELLIDKNLAVHHRDLNSKGQPVLFSQVNRFANEVLVDLVVSKVLAYKPKAKIFDLYSGDGNFLLATSAALRERECIGVELNPGLVTQGRRSATDQKLGKVKFVISNVEKFVESVSIDPADVIILDPPRTGCDPKAMLVLGSSPREKVIYVSCEPTTLARDLRLLKETAIKWGLILNVQSLQTLDMFPQTEHIETVVEFSIDKIDTGTTTH